MAGSNCPMRKPGSMPKQNCCCGRGQPFVSGRRTARPWSARRRFPRRPGFDDAAIRAGLAGWPIITRPTGGGTVPQGPGILNLAMALDIPDGFTIEDGYRLITRVIAEALAPDGLSLSRAKRRAAFAMANGTCPWPGANWSAPPSAGAASKKANIACWPMR